MIVKGVYGNAQGWADLKIMCFNKAVLVYIPRLTYFAHLHIQLAQLWGKEVSVRGKA